ncbi:uncharacterized protein LOC129921846 [Biomphalaria glabrata]|uniref:Uncharacterized protein LOC129921846 n=1 Tax=Biomphalaria glabrata TaxID=6526 RepID=A0A9W2YDW2_BIOGL|nr:uncharacterized protein LOC129921846 [Biomphalaria glabrata]XP_055860977.1 uncharacterized protein LOC129921846 [Biomphalaria glabrata]
MASKNARRKKWNSDLGKIASKSAILQKKSGIIKKKYYKFFLHKSRVVNSSYNIIGDHEAQEAEGGEVDLHQFYNDCKKNPGHIQFIPVEKFTLKHLPEGLQDPCLYKLIKASADMTVRVSVTMTSPDRPQFWAGTTQPYPFCNLKNEPQLRTGSGRIWNVNKMKDGEVQDGYYHSSYTKCWCQKCQDSDCPSNVWWEFSVHTACHVVFDVTEASHTKLRLFFDSDASPLVIVDKFEFLYSSKDYDICALNCVTCDKALGEKLMKIYKCHLDIWEEILFNPSYSRDKHKMAFIVSHPHGCPKQISIGQWKDKILIHDRTKFTYSTTTCPGSSGATVHCVGYSGTAWRSEFVHSGTKSGLNYSGVGQVFSKSK